MATIIILAAVLGMIWRLGTLAEAEMDAINEPIYKAREQRR